MIKCLGVCEWQQDLYYERIEIGMGGDWHKGVMGQ
jgi:hypothetical protein